MDKRYTDFQAGVLIRRLVKVRSLPEERARIVFRALLQARLSDVVIRDSDVLIKRAKKAEIAGYRKGVDMWLRAMSEARGQWPSIGPLKDITLTVGGPRDMRIEVGAELSTALTLQTYALLGRVGDRLRVCRCGEMFVRRRRQEFCSQRCQKRFQARRLRGDQSPLA